MRLNEQIICNTINETINDFLNHRCIFNVDIISEMTLRYDSRFLYESEEDYSWILKRQNWEINNYKRFLDIVENTRPDLKGFLTYHGMDEIGTDDWVTYTLKGYDVAFALHFLAPGQIDICNLVNNSELKGIGDYVLQFAKSEGGTQMDNYRGNDGEEGKLGTMYRKNGFDKQTWFDKFNPEFQPEDPEWRLDTERWGTPDVEGLELSKHRMKYNNPQRKYREKFDKRVNPKFNR